MAVIAFCSAKGAPGVTTTAMLVAALWPRPVLLVDADVAGGDIALRLPDPQGRPLAPDRGLLTLLPIARRGLAPHVLHEHSQELSGGTRIIAGLGGPEQARAVGALWPILAETFARADHDVIIDAGRVGPDSVHLPLLQRADLVVSVLRPGLPAVVHAREQVRTLSHALPPAPAGPVQAVLAIHPIKRDTVVGEAVAAVRAQTPAALDAGHLAWDPAAAEMFEGRIVGRPERTMLIRSARQVVTTLVTALQQADADRPATIVVPTGRGPSAAIPADAPTPPAGLRPPSAAQPRPQPTGPTGSTGSTGPTGPAEPTQVAKPAPTEAAEPRPANPAESELEPAGPPLPATAAPGPSR